MAKITAYVEQNWTANGTNGVLRLEPIRATNPAETLPAGTPIVSFAELEEVTPAGINYWRAASWPGRTVRYFLRAGPGIPKDHDFIAGGFVQPVDVTAAVDAAVKAATDPLKAELATATARISAARSALS